MRSPLPAAVALLLAGLALPTGSALHGCYEITTGASAVYLGDVDTFSFAVGAGEDVRVTVDFTPATGTHVARLAAQAPGVEAQESVGEGRIEVFLADVEAGTLEVQVRMALLGNEDVGAQPYHLAVRRTGPCATH